MSDVDNEMRGDIYQYLPNSLRSISNLSTHSHDMFKMADLILEPSTRPYTVAQP
jgi:hypothetical protein